MHQDKTWTKWVLIPFWIAHLIFLAVVITSLAYLMLNHSGTYGNVPIAWAVFMTLFCLTLAVELVEMVLHSFGVLKPWLFLVFQVYKCSFSSMFLGTEVYEYVEKNQGSIYLWALIVIVAMVLSFHGSLVYGAVMLRRHRRAKRHKYAKEQGYESNSSKPVARRPDGA